MVYRYEKYHNKSDGACQFTVISEHKEQKPIQAAIYPISITEESHHYKVLGEWQGILPE